MDSRTRTFESVEKVKRSLIIMTVLIVPILGLLWVSPAWAADPVDDVVTTDPNTPVTIDVLTNDVDNLDVIFANLNMPNHICPGDGAGAFISCNNVSADTNVSRGIALGDLNGDGNLDVVFANTGAGQRNRVCLGNGRAGFSICNDVSTDTYESTEVALGDLNSDGDLDAVFANGFGGDQRNRVCLGDGTGGFSSCSDVSADANQSNAVVLEDLNGDGNLDAVFANAGGTGQRNRICLGSGAGSFSNCSDVSADANGSFDVALDYINGDANLDVVFANAAGRNRVCQGDGTGGFSSCSDVSTDANFSFGVALGDLNSDSNLDAVFANAAGQRNRACLGDGTGGFSSCSDVSTDANFSFGVALGDLNSDSNPDAIFANENFQLNRICLGNGTGGFLACSDVSTNTNRSWGVALGLLGLDITTMVIGNPANGTATLNVDGTVIYTPTIGFVGTDVFTYSIEGEVANVTITVNAPEIEVFDSGISIPNGGSVDFGTTSLGTPLTKTFTISNTGMADLLLNLPINLPAGFSVVNNFGSTTVISNSSTTFQIQCDASAAGIFSGNLSFANNDPDENPYGFVVGCSVNAPEVEVLDGGISIPSSGSVDFGTTTLGTPLVKTFTISNTGTADLTLILPITVPIGFSVLSSFGSTTVAPNSSTTFQIQCDASAAGIFSGNLSFANNDPDENPYGFVVSYAVNTIAPSPPSGDGGDQEQDDDHDLPITEQTISQDRAGESSETAIPGVKFLPETGVQSISIWSILSSRLALGVVVIGIGFSMWLVRCVTRRE